MGIFKSIASIRPAVEPGNDRVMAVSYSDHSSPDWKKAMGSDKPVIYKSFLIRIWGDETGSQRRVMVTRVDASDQQYYFANLDDLMMFLLQEMEKLS